MKIVFRVDASIKIGSGHVMRCLTLAGELQSYGVEVQFICRAHSGNMIELIRGKEFSVHELPAPESQESQPAPGADTESVYTLWLGTSQEQDTRETIEAFQEKRPDWLIIDHYALGQIWETQLRPYVRKIMVIDDLADRPHECDLLLDQNYFLDGDSRYNDLVPATCTKLLGPQYALLRPEFAKARKHLKTRTGKVQRVFVFFGGTDSDNLTGKAIEALSFPEFSHLDVDVVIGSHNPHRAKIERLVKTRLRTTLHVQVGNIAELMGQADLALGAGGSTTWERLCLGLPSLVVTIAENQTPFTEYLHHEKYLTRLETPETLDIQKLRQALSDTVEKDSVNRVQSSKGMEIVSGDGASQVARFLMQGISSKSWTIRHAVFADCEIFWYWANDLEVRSNAFNQDYISWEDHQEWFKQKLQDSETILLVVESVSGPVGQVRFEGPEGRKEISYSIGRQYRGYSLGEKLLKMTIDNLDKKVDLVVAEVKGSNIPSIKIFRKLGFKEEELEKKQGKLFSMNLKSFHEDSHVA
jgi:UDP-2,4-diacetamido-2,4,6-trideoxy-beta-L-altropyranose hydrolase